MLGSYWGNIAELVRYGDRFELTITCDSNPSFCEFYELYETNPESLLREADYYSRDYDEGNDDDYDNPCFEKFKDMSWDSVDILRRMLEDDKRTGWIQLLPGYSKYDCEV